MSMERDFRYGYIDGLEAKEVNSRLAFRADDYYSGYIVGSNERSNERLIMPDWMTAQQMDAVKRLYARSEDGSPSREDFFKKVENYGEYCGFGWCGMFVGIEKDGYTHT